MAGRKPKYDVETLEIGQKLALPHRVKEFKDQYIYNFNKRGKGKYRAIVSEDKLFVERIA